LDAVFKDTKCKAGQMIDSSKTCEATCKSGTHGNPVKYTCTDGKWNKPKSIVCKPDKKAICKVDDEFLAKLKKLNAEFKEEKCQKGEIDEDNTCEASCKEHFKGDKVQYTCDKNGKFTAPEEKDIACQNSFGKLGVLGALLCLFALFNKKFRTIMVDQDFLKFFKEKDIPMSATANPVKILTSES
jgi:hypothetical protein